MFIQPDIFRFVQIKSPTVNEQASDKGGNLFFRCQGKEAGGRKIVGEEGRAEKGRQIAWLAIKKFEKSQVII